MLKSSTLDAIDLALLIVIIAVCHFVSIFLGGGGGGGGQHM